MRASDLDPFLNFTALVSGNFTELSLTCFQFGYAVYTDTLTHYQSFGSIGNYALSFLFNQMGEALSFKEIFDEITVDTQNQYYTDIYYQYGRLIRRIFDFENVTAARLKELRGLAGEWINVDTIEEVAKFEFNLDAENTQLARKAAEWINTIGDWVDDFNPAFAPTFTEAAPQALKNPTFDQRPAAEKKQLQSPAMDVEAFSNGMHRVQAPEFQWQFFWGAFQGGINALPSENLVQRCYGNITASIGNWTDTYNAAVDQQWVAMMTAFQHILRAVYGSSYSCIFSLLALGDASQYEAIFGTTTVLFNILFNLGFIYTDVKNIIV